FIFMTLTTNQKKKVAGLEPEQWDRIKNDVTDEDLRTLEISKEDFRILRVPNLVVRDIAKSELIILEEMLLKLYNSLKNNQRAAVYEEIIEAHYLFSDSEKRELKRDFQQAELFNLQETKIKKLNLLAVEKILNQQIQKNPSYGLPGNNTPERQTKLRELREKLEKSRGKNQRVLESYLEIFQKFLNATQETSLETLEAAKNGEALEEQFGEDHEFKEVLAEIKKEIAEKAANCGQVLKEEIAGIKEQSSRLFAGGYKGAFEEGKKSLEALEKRCQETEEKLTRILGKISARSGEMRIRFGSGIEEKFEGLREFIGIIKKSLEENQEKLLDLIIAENLSFIKTDFIQSAITSLNAGTNDKIAALTEKITAIKHENDLLQEQITELKKEKLEESERILIENIKKVASYNFLPLGEEDLKKIKRDSVISELEEKQTEINHQLQKIREDFTKTRQTFSNHLREFAVTLTNSSSGFTNSNDFNLVRLEQQAKTIKNECQAKKNKIQQLENTNRGLAAEKRELISQLAEQEELLDSFQKQVIKAEETEEKYNDLELKYRTELQSFLVANNTIRSEFKKEEEKLKDKIENLKQQLRTNQAEKKENLALFVSLQVKKRELKQLKTIVKSKLEDNNLLKSLLTNQELLTITPPASNYQRTLKLIESQLCQAKTQIQTKLSEEEINQLCQLQTEITSLEMKLENLTAEKIAMFSLPKSEREKNFSVMPRTNSQETSVSSDIEETTENPKSEENDWHIEQEKNNFQPDFSLLDTDESRKKLAQAKKEAFLEEEIINNKKDQINQATSVEEVKKVISGIVKGNSTIHSYWGLQFTEQEKNGLPDYLFSVVLRYCQSTVYHPISGGEEEIRKYNNHQVVIISDRVISHELRLKRGKNYQFSPFWPPTEKMSAQAFFFGKEHRGSLLLKEKETSEEELLSFFYPELELTAESIRELKAAPKPMKSYVFCYCHLTLKLVQFLTKIAGVISFLNHQKSDPQLPEPVSPEAIKKLFSGPLQKSFTSSKSTDLNIGDLVLIKEGSFANCEGRITYLDEKKVKLDLDFLGRKISLELLPENCQKLPV
ncbi:22773_t:CDS:10, partial [Gigaspora margarita]